jgi:hypothetical protein
MCQSQPPFYVFIYRSIFPPRLVPYGFIYTVQQSIIRLSTVILNQNFQFTQIILI